LLPPAFPVGEQSFDVMPLRVGELEAVEEPADLGWVVVRDRGLEPLT